MSNSTNDIASLWRSMTYEVYRATASLMYLLQGMETVRERELPPYNRLSPVLQQDLACYPKLSYVDVPPSLSGAPFDPNDMLRREGEAEQLAFKGWVEQVYHYIWEGQYRNELKRAFEGPNAIRPEADVIGDFGYIRNDLIHNRGIATVKETGRCKVLTWFKPGETIILGMRHVFDFLNQMGMMSSFPVVRTDGAVARCMISPDMEDALRNRSTPAIVSLRALMDKNPEDGATYPVVGVVFENGVFVNIRIHGPPDGRSVRERAEFFSQTRIDEDGNVRLADGRVKDRESLYKEAVDALMRKGPKVGGTSIPGPWFKARE